MPERSASGEPGVNASVLGRASWRRQAAAGESPFAGVRTTWTARSRCCSGCSRSVSGTARSGTREGSHRSVTRSRGPSPRHPSLEGRGSGYFGIGLGTRHGNSGNDSSPIIASDDFLGSYKGRVQRVASLDRNTSSRLDVTDVAAPASDSESGGTWSHPRISWS
jgi:hypothetical protein